MSSQQPWKTVLSDKTAIKAGQSSDALHQAVAGAPVPPMELNVGVEQPVVSAPVPPMELNAAVAVAPSVAAEPATSEGNGQRRFLHMSKQSTEVLMEQAGELDRSLASLAGEAAAHEGSLASLVLEAGQRREALVEAMQRFEAKQHEALKSHMRLVALALRSCRTTCKQPPQLLRNPMSGIGGGRADPELPAVDDGPAHLTEAELVSTRSSWRPGWSLSPRLRLAIGKGSQQVATGAPERSTSSNKQRNKIPVQEAAKDGTANQVAVLSSIRESKDVVCTKVDTIAQGLLAVKDAVDDVQQSLKARRVLNSPELPQGDAKKNDDGRVSTTPGLRAPLKENSDNGRAPTAPGQSPSARTPRVAKMTISRPEDESALLEGKDPTASAQSMQRKQSIHDWRRFAYESKNPHLLVSKLRERSGTWPRVLRRPALYLADRWDDALNAKEPRRVGPLANVVQSNTFEFICTAVIMLNVAFMFIGTNMQMEYIGTKGKSPGGTELEATLVLIDTIFVGYYTIELALKMWVHGKFFWFNADAQWNIFDFVLVVASILGTAMEWKDLESSRTSSGLTAGNDYVGMRILRLARIGRIVRALKAVNFLEDLRLMLHLVLASFFSVFWVLVVLLLVLLVFTLLCMQCVVDYLKAEPTMFGQFEDFKDTWACGLTLVLSVTGGTDWVEPFSKMQLIDRAAAGTFLAYILVYILVIVNVVTSVFLSRVMKFAEPSPQAIVEEKELMVARDYEVLEKMFRKVDQDSTGGVSLEEFQNCVGSKEFGTFLAARGIDIKEARAFFNLVTDRTYEGEVDVGEMVRLCTRLKGSASSIDLQIMRAEINATCRRIEEALACGASSPLSLAN